MRVSSYFQLREFEANAALVRHCDSLADERYEIRVALNLAGLASRAKVKQYELRAQRRRAA